MNWSNGEILFQLNDSWIQIQWGGILYILALTLLITLMTLLNILNFSAIIISMDTLSYHHSHLVLDEKHESSSCWILYSVAGNIWALAQPIIRFGYHTLLIPFATIWAQIRPCPEMKYWPRLRGKKFLASKQTWARSQTRSLSNLWTHAWPVHSLRSSPIRVGGMDMNGPIYNFSCPNTKRSWGKSNRSLFPQWDVSWHWSSKPLRYLKYMEVGKHMDPSLLSKRKIQEVVIWDS